MSDCKHESFAARVEVNRLGDGPGTPIRTFLAEITVRCSQCDLPFHFVGLDAGLSFTKPTVNFGATTLNAPIAPGEGHMPRTLRYDLSEPQ